MAVNDDCFGEKMKKMEKIISENFEIDWKSEDQKRDLFEDKDERVKYEKLIRSDK